MFIKKAALVLLTLTAAPGLAGTITSGGGLIFDSEANPWFLQNTSTVKYCIQIDEANFGLDATSVNRIVDQVIAEWKVNFQDNAWTKVYSPGELEPYGSIQIATQTFVREECNAQTDLRLQFGVLSRKQYDDYGIVPASTAAITVRTEYDKVKLKGKGFIYVGAQSGPLKFGNAATAKEPWAKCEGCILKMTLMHEFGHVFGLAHGGDSSSLMNERFVHLITQESFISYNEIEQIWPQIKKTFTEMTKIFASEKHFSRVECGGPLGDAIVAEYFKLPAGPGCLRITIDAERRLVVESASSTAGPFTEVGRVKDKNFWGLHSNIDSLVNVQLSGEQKVFTKLPREFFGFLNGPSVRIDTIQNVNLTLHDGTVRPVTYTLKPNNAVDLRGAVNERIFTLDF